MTYQEFLEQTTILRQQLEKYKKDIEQVDLFGMERSDYEEKKQLCRNIVLQLRRLEQQLREDETNDSNNN